MVNTVTLKKKNMHSALDAHMLGPPKDANFVRGLQRIGQALLQVRLPSDALHAKIGPFRAS